MKLGLLHKQRGFLLTEVLIAILILSIALTATVAGIARALKIADRSEEITESVYLLEHFLFELETGKRADLIFYGGEQEINSKEKLDVVIEPHDSGMSEARIRLISWNGKEILSFIAMFYREGAL